MKSRNRKRINDYDESLTPEAELLDKYLFRYRTCIMRKNALTRRREEIKLEFENPLSAVGFDGMPRGSGVGSGSAAISYRLDEIDTKIKAQLAAAEKTLIEMIDISKSYDGEIVLDGCLERSVLESRYIDGAGWDRVCRDNHCSKSKAIRNWKKGLSQLLTFKKVSKILEAYEKGYQTYRALYENLKDLMHQR